MRGLEGPGRVQFDCPRLQSQEGSEYHRIRRIDGRPRGLTSAFLIVCDAVAGMTIESHAIDRAFPVNPTVTLIGAFPRALRSANIVRIDQRRLFTRSYVDGSGDGNVFFGCDNKILQMQLILLPIVFLCLAEAGRFFVPA